MRFATFAIVLVAVTAAACSSEATPSSSSAWSRVPHDEAIFGGEGGQFMEAVVAAGPGLVAVGGGGWDEVSGGTAAVWTSADGITWSRVSNDEAVFGGDVYVRMLGVVAGGPGVVAIGFDGPSLTSHNSAVWTSPDGVTWSRVPNNEAVFGASEMSSVTVGGPGLVAVGRDESGNAQVWTSPDGITWSRVLTTEQNLGSESIMGMESVTVGGPGLVAVGYAGSSDEVDAAVWTSPDGVTWSRVPNDEAVFGNSEIMWSVTTGGPGLVAVGRDDSGGNAVVWTSPDGFNWSQVPRDEAVFGGDGEQAMSSVSTRGSGLVAVGWDEASGDNAAAWTSSDGIIWSRVPADDTALRAESVQAMMSVTVGGPGIVAVGWDAKGGGAAVWVEATED